MSTPFRKLSNPIYRWLCCLSVAFVVCAVLLPMPFSSWSPSGVEKDLSQPFPCQNRPCGCRSAEQCWKKCCCFTNSQKVAWAKANSVQLPDYVVAAAKQETKSPKKACALCSTSKASRSKATCESVTVAPGSQTKAATGSPRRSMKTKATKWVLSVYAAECQGQPSVSVCFPTTIMPPQIELVAVSVELTEILHEISERLSSETPQPPLPPPKIV